jgi:hypothetical protein
MKTRRRSSLAALAVAAAALLCLAFAGGAMAATQTTGPYQVTDEITHDGSGDTATTTATYTIEVPADPVVLTAATSTDAIPFVQDISHVDVGVCNDLADRTYDIQRDGLSSASYSFKPGGDAGSINGADGPVIKWDQGQGTGIVKYSYTVPGNWDPTPTTLFIKSGSYGGSRDAHDPFTATVQGIACKVTPPDEPETPGSTPTGTPAGTVAGQQVAGTQQVLGERVTRGTARLAGASGCQRKAFKVSVRGSQIRKVAFSIDGKRVKKVRASASGKVYSITINPNRFKPGSHLVTAKATFAAASNTKAKTMKVRFARCVRTAPAFTG